MRTVLRAADHPLVLFVQSLLLKSRLLLALLLGLELGLETIRKAPVEARIGGVFTLAVDFELHGYREQADRI